MSKFLEFLTKFLSFFVTIKKPEVKPTPIVPNPVKGLFSMDVVRPPVLKNLFDSPLLIGAFKGKVDLAKQFGLKFPCYLLPQSNQKFTVSLVDGTLKIVFDDTCPKLYAEKFFEVECDIDFISCDKDKCRISLVGLPDFIIRFVDKL